MHPQAKTDFKPALVDYATAAKMLGGISKGTVKNMISRGDLQFVRMGRRTMFRPGDIEACVNSLAERTARQDG